MKQLKKLNKIKIQYTTNNYYEQFNIGTIQKEGNFELSSRQLLSLKGQDSMKFLQSFISNDMNKMKETNILNCVFMNTKGRVICESLISNPFENEYWIECDKEVVPKLKQHIQKYKLRSKFNLEELTSLKVYSSFEFRNDEKLIFKDPRNECLGFRIYSSQQLGNLNTFDNYEKIRIMNGICEGVVDIPIEEYFPSELNFDFLNGVSYSKGCYLGQELTARTHFSGMTRKRFFPVYSIDGTNLETNQEVVDLEDKFIGIIKSVNISIGLSKIKFENVLNSRQLKTKEGKLLNLVKPTWLEL